jgi:antitoxin CptB
MDELRAKRARFRAWRRGFREADLILGPFADRHVFSMDEATLSQFERLLDLPDHDVYAWITGAAAPPPAFDDALMAELRAFRPSDTPIEDIT